METIPSPEELVGIVAITSLIHVINNLLPM